MPHILVVSSEDRIADRIAGGLEDEGYDVMVCPGPRSPRFECPGGQDGRCALAVCADAVIVDGWLATDAARSGPPSWHLAGYYRSRGIPVLFLVGPDGVPGPISDLCMTALDREEPVTVIADAVGDLLGRVRALAG